MEDTKAMCSHIKRAKTSPEALCSRSSRAGQTEGEEDIGMVRIAR
jgi:hypothetical protein